MFGTCVEGENRFGSLRSLLSQFRRAYRAARQDEWPPLTCWSRRAPRVQETLAPPSGRRLSRNLSGARGETAKTGARCCVGGRLECQVRGALATRLCLLSRIHSCNCPQWPNEGDHKSVASLGFDRGYTLSTPRVSAPYVIVEQVPGQSPGVDDCRLHGPVGPGETSVRDHQLPVGQFLKWSFQNSHVSFMTG